MTADFEQVDICSDDLCEWLGCQDDDDYSVSVSKIADSDCPLNFVNVFRNQRIMACIRWDSQRRKVVHVKPPPSRCTNPDVLEFVSWLQDNKQEMSKVLNSCMPVSTRPKYMFRDWSGRMTTWVVPTCTGIG